MTDLKRQAKLAGKSPNKKPYRKPGLQVYGTLTQMTQTTSATPATPSDNAQPVGPNRRT
jgi:hypothetical protein